MSNGAKRVRELNKRIEEISTEYLARRTKLMIGRLKESGVMVAVIYRRTEQVFRCGRSTLTEAFKDGVMCWMIDAPMVDHLASKGVKYIITIEKDAGDVWVSRIEDWQDDEKLFRSDNPADMKTDRMGFALRYLPVKHMVHLPGEISLLSGVRGGSK